MYLGDIRLGDTVDLKFCTVTTTGAPTQLAGSPVMSAYPGNSTTQLTAGITLSVDFDGVTGLNNVRIVATSGNGYATATDYAVVITTGTVGGTSVVGYVVGTFSIEKRSALMPVTAGRTVVVDAAGLADATTVKVGASGAGVSAVKLGAHIPAILQGLTTSGGSTTAVVANATTGVDGGVPSATDDFYNGRVIVFTSGALAGQATSISDYAGSTQTFTVVALTGAPASGVSFVIV